MRLALKIVSACDHLDLYFLPPKLWEARLPAGYRERGPRVVEGADGARWQTDGVDWGPSGRKPEGSLYEESFGNRPGNAAERLDDMDRDGIYAQVIYGHVPGFRCKDADLQRAVSSAYNDWALEFTAQNPQRFCALATLPESDPANVAAEVLRAAKLGHRGAELRWYAAPEPVIGKSWEPFWAAAAEAGIPICFHMGGGMHSLNQRDPRSWMRPPAAAIMEFQMDEVLAGLIFSGVLERHPSLRVVFAEIGYGWLPYLLEIMDRQYERYLGSRVEIRTSIKPSVQFARQVYVTFIEDFHGEEIIPKVGVDNVLWGSDYPHADSTWLRSQTAIDDSLGALDAASRAKVLSANAAGLFGLEL
jgi:predicted TIM-barrel fold metal-dependent hydrolase